MKWGAAPPFATAPLSTPRILQAPSSGLPTFGVGDNVKLIAIGGAIAPAVALDAYRDRLLKAIESR